MRPRLPAIEVADNGDVVGIGCPYREPGSSFVAHLSGMGTELLPGTIMAAFDKEMEVVVCEEISLYDFHIRLSFS